MSPPLDVEPYEPYDERAPLPRRREPSGGDPW